MSWPAPHCVFSVLPYTCSFTESTVYTVIWQTLRVFTYSLLKKDIYSSVNKTNSVFLKWTKTWTNRKGNQLILCSRCKVIRKRTWFPFWSTSALIGPQLICCSHYSSPEALRPSLLWIIIIIWIIALETFTCNKMVAAILVISTHIHVVFG